MKQTTTATSHKTQAIKLVNLTKRFPNGVFSNIKNNFEVNYGEIHALFGENGAGKSTLVKMIFGELQPTEGEIHVNNQNVGINYNPRLANGFKIGIVHQHFALIDNFTVFENVVLGYELKSDSKCQRNEVIFEARKQKLLSEKQQKMQLLQNQIKNLQAKFKRTTAQIKDTNHLQILQTQHTQTLAKLDMAIVEQDYAQKLEQLLKWKDKQNLTYFFRWSDVRQRLQNLIQKFDLQLDLDAHVSEIGISKQQKTEILKVLFRQSKIIIFDEPTSVLSPHETVNFLKSLKKYKLENKAIIFISHKIDEIRAIADRVSVLQKGKMVGTFAMNQITNDKLVELMIGSKIQPPVRQQTVAKPKPLPHLIVQNLDLNIGKKPILKQVDFTLYQGEILGIAGIEGNGQSMLLRTLFGLNRHTQGKIQFFDHQNHLIDLGKMNVLQRQKYKISFLSKDRIKENLLLQESLTVNVAFNDLQNARFFPNYLFNKTAAAATAQQIVNKYRVTGFFSPEQPIGSLSGGNIQKFIIGRELEKNPDLILIDEPTWGVDIGAVNFLHSLLFKFKQVRKTVLFVSSDLQEIVNIADRVLVMNQGQIIGVLDAKTTPNLQQRIGDLISGKQ